MHSSCLQITHGNAVIHHKSLILVKWANRLHPPRPCGNAARRNYPDGGFWHSITRPVQGKSDSAVTIRLPIRISASRARVPDRNVQPDKIEDDTQLPALPRMPNPIPTRSPPRQDMVIGCRGRCDWGAGDGHIQHFLFFSRSPAIFLQWPCPLAIISSYRPGSVGHLADDRGSSAERADSF